MVREPPATQVSRGCCMPNDGVWLEGPTEELILNVNASTSMLKMKFHWRRNILAHHLWVWKSKCKNMDINPIID